jgi:hypothetical protein
MITPGLKFYCYPLSLLDPQPGLERTPSMYGHGDVEFTPTPNRLYTICKDGSVQAFHEPEAKIGWTVFETDDGWAYNITQVGFTPKRCLVSYHSRTDDYSRHAAIYEDEEGGDPEVTSDLRM